MKYAAFCDKKNYLTLVVLRLIIFAIFFYSNCLDIIKNRLPLHHLNKVKQQYMNIHTSISLAVVHIILLVVVTSNV